MVDRIRGEGSIIIDIFDLRERERRRRRGGKGRDKEEETVGIGQVTGTSSVVCTYRNRLCELDLNWQNTSIKPSKSADMVILRCCEEISSADFSIFVNQRLMKCSVAWVDPLSITKWKFIHQKMS